MAHHDLAPGVGALAARYTTQGCSQLLSYHCRTSSWGCSSCLPFDWDELNPAMCILNPSVDLLHTIDRTNNMLTYFAPRAFRIKCRVCLVISRVPLHLSPLRNHPRARLSLSLLRSSYPPSPVSTTHSSVYIQLGTAYALSGYIISYSRPILRQTSSFDVVLAHDPCADHQFLSYA
ncbi:hypothetical protein BC827DRAFT_497897 [Russula dissimulans]|nr:hypothetical protein BC827DRAFT_497897 [Russula dissimulans]